MLPLHSSFSPLAEHSIVTEPLYVSPLATAEPAAFRHVCVDVSQNTPAETGRSDCSM